MGKLRSSPRSALTGPSRSIEELPRQQGVRQVTDLDEIGSLWPVGDKAEGLLDFVINERRERRRARASTGKKK